MRNFLRSRWCIATFCFLLCQIGFTSCDDDDDEQGGSSLIGYWLTKDELEDYVSGQDLTGNVWYDDGCYFAKNNSTMYRFINDNSVEYGGADVYKTPQSNPLYTFSTQGYRLYVVWNPYRRYSYVRSGNKIVITNGDILTVEGDKLYLDGDWGSFEKVKN